AVLAVFGNMVAAWSWFGTNQLGIALHAYGFDNRLATGCAVFWVSQLVVAALGMVPLKFWARFGPAQPVKTYLRIPSARPQAGPGFPLPAFLSLSPFPNPPPRTRFALHFPAVAVLSRPLRLPAPAPRPGTSACLVRPDRR